MRFVVDLIVVVVKTVDSFLKFVLYIRQFHTNIPQIHVVFHDHCYFFWEFRFVNKCNSLRSYLFHAENSVGTQTHTQTHIFLVILFWSPYVLRTLHVIQLFCLWILLSIATTWKQCKGNLCIYKSYGSLRMTTWYCILMAYSYRMLLVCFSYIQQFYFLFIWYLEYFVTNDSFHPKIERRFGFSVFTFVLKKKSHKLREEYFA